MKTGLKVGFGSVAAAILLAGGMFVISLKSPKADQETDMARCIKSQQDLRTLSTVLDLYKLNTQHYPSTEDGLHALLTPIAYIKKLAKDPWQSDYHYVFPASLNSELAYDLYSFGKNGKDDAGAQDDIPAWGEPDCNELMKEK